MLGRWHRSVGNDPNRWSLCCDSLYEQNAVRVGTQIACGVVRRTVMDESLEVGFPAMIGRILQQ